MQQRAPQNPALCSATSIGISGLLVAYSYWLRTPAANEFNERLFGQYYTAGAILMLACHGLAFFSLTGASAAATFFSWARKEGPLAILWIATITTIVAPIIAVGIIKGR